MKKFVFIASLGFAMACGEKDDCSNSADCPVSAEEILAKLEILDSRIEEMLITSCSNTEQCIATPYGAKACGGPVTYLIHSSNMDLIRLNQLVNEYNMLNAIHNDLVGAISDCSIIAKPEVECASGNCQVVEND
ncbi:hypothetical protein [Ekhidna sp. To15]|uniref:hypothetical protein n=1 Tax=Ekhidna sp. To15 TaxID=3395267 RepID=UPI003F52145D